MMMMMMMMMMIMMMIMKMTYHAFRVVGRVEVIQRIHGELEIYKVNATLIFLNLV